MNFDESIIVCALKGTPPCPDEDGTLPTPAFTKCTACKADLVYDARNQPRIDKLKMKPCCGTCAADLILGQGQPTVATVQGILGGKDSDRGVPEFLERLTDRAKERVH